MIAIELSSCGGCVWPRYLVGRNFNYSLPADWHLHAPINLSTRLRATRDLNKELLNKCHIPKVQKNDQISILVRRTTAVAPLLGNRINAYWPAPSATCLSTNANRYLVRQCHQARMHLEF